MSVTDKFDLSFGARVCVTGGAGLIGSYLVEQLLDRGCEVTVIDDLSKGTLDNLKAVENKYALKKINLEENHDQLFEGIDYVFHLASRAYGIGYSSTNHVGLMIHNELVTNTIARNLNQHPPKGVCILSSSCVYPDSDIGFFSEERFGRSTICLPESANRGYGLAKQLLESKVSFVCQELDISLKIVRPFNVYSERYLWMGDKSQALPMLVHKAVTEDQKIVVWGSGEQQRNYIHALDLARKIVGLCDSHYVGPINIGASMNVSIRRLAEMLLEELGRKNLRIEFDRSKPEGCIIKTGEFSLQTNLGLPLETISLEQGLARMCQWGVTNFG